MSLFYQLTYFVTAFLAFAFGALVFLTRPKEPVVKAFAAFTTSIVCWIISLYFFYTLTDRVSLLLVGRINFVFAEMAAFSALTFIYYFPERTVEVPRSWRIGLQAMTAILIVLTLGSDLIDENEIVHGISRSTSYGSLYLLFVAYFTLLSCAGAYILYRKIKKASAAERHKLVLFAVTWGIGVLLAATTNIFIPLATHYYDIQRLGPVVICYFVGLLGYAVVRHELLNIKMLAVELMVFLFTLLFVLNFGLAVSRMTQMVAGASLFFGVIFGILLIRDTRLEFGQREHLRALALELEESNRQLRQMDEIKSEFISIASHQLRTPVSVIKGYLSLMLDGAYGPVSGSFLDKLEQMFEMNERLVILINNLLNVSRIEKNRIEYSCGEVDIKSLMRRVVAGMSIKIKGRKLSLNFIEPGDAVSKVYADPDKLTEVFVNLIDNAIKYTPSGDIDIIMEKSPTNGSVIIRVRDTGVGMDQDDMAHIFEKYYRPAKPNATRQSGMSMGLGLYVCARFLSSMGGSIWVEHTAPGQGTTMAVSLPTAAAESCTIRKDEPLVEVQGGPNPL